MIRRTKIKKSILIGLILACPIITFAGDRPKTNLTTNSGTELLNQTEFTENKKNTINKLHSEGAISKQEADSLLEFEINKTNQKTDINSNYDNGKLRIQSYNLDNNKMNMNFSESESNVNIKLKNIDKIKKSEIIKINSGWQLILELSTEKDFDKSTIPKNTNYISRIELTKFNPSTYILKIIDNKKYQTRKPTINENNHIKIDLKKIIEKSEYRKKYRIPFMRRFKKNNPNYNQNNDAIVPPVGDIASGSLVLQNRGFIKLNGPNISLDLNNASAKDALIKITKMGGYGLVITNDFNGSQSNSISSTGETNNDPKVTLSFVDEDYSIAFNSILLSAGLQAKRNDNLLIVGNNVLGKSFGPQLSKVYRLNQSTASAAADYLATLGASISKVDTFSESSESNGTSNQSVGESYKFIDSYSASTGPLTGLIGTTDSRLQTITLVGSSDLILIAEKYLKQLDIRQRQVALSVKILDVELTDSENFNNDLAFRTGSTFIVNEKGKLSSAFGNFIPPGLNSIGAPQEGRTFSSSTSSSDGEPPESESSFSSFLETAVTPNPGFQYTANELYNFLSAQIRSTNTKLLANPTLILSESAEKITGGAEVIGQVGSTTASIGRPYANESFVTLGTNLITNYEVTTNEEGGYYTCNAEFSTAGLTFGARVHKIDDNGYVTFSLSPKLTSVSEIVDIPNCGAINILSVRRLDTGKLRVRDSQTLILTGVISDLDSEVITKTPILGDIPILGRLFRTTSGSKRNSELVIMVTPKIISDFESISKDFIYETNTTTNNDLKVINE